MKKSFSALATVFFMTTHAVEMAGGADIGHEQPDKALLGKEAPTQRQTSYHKTIVKEFLVGQAIPVVNHHQEMRDGAGELYAGSLSLIGVKQVNDCWLATYSGDLIYPSDG